MNRRVRLTPGWASDFGALCSLQEELDLHGLEREDDTSALGTVEHARGKQCRDIAVNGFDITSHAARRLANRDPPGWALLWRYPSEFLGHSSLPTGASGSPALNYVLGKAYGYEPLRVW